MFTERPKLAVKRSASASTLSLIALSVALAAPFADTAQASSHREAPFIATLPQVDGADYYMFRSYEKTRENFVTMVATYLPVQVPSSGPNYFKLDPNALYEIHITNDGGAVENITFQFKLQNTLDDNTLTIAGRKMSIPIVQNGSADVNAPNSPALNVHEKYTINVIRGPRRTGASLPVTNLSKGGTTFDKPVDNIGTKTINDYLAYRNKHIYDVGIPGCATPGRVFVGQVKDPFVINLGEIFDLVNIKFPATELRPFAEFAGADAVSRANVTALVLEVDAGCLTEGKGNIIGSWTTSSLPAQRMLGAVAGSGLDGAQQVSGSFVQLSRIGAPLVNEVVIGLKDKNKFNNSEPKDDAQFLDYVDYPTFPQLLENLFGSAGVKAPTNFPRTDLRTAFLTGVPGLNQPSGVTPSEMLRLNVTTPVTAKGKQNPLGVLGGDNAGFPNGRRLGDDIVDIELRVAMGVLCTLNIGGCTPAQAPAGGLHYTDGAYISDAFFAEEFPYLRAPLPGSPSGDDAVKASAAKN